jgi:hypothetical protein
MKKIFVLFFFILIFESGNTQTLQSFQKEKLSLNSFPSVANSISKESPADALWLLFPFNPMLVVENQKVYFGLTKEVSFGIARIGNIAAEYSYIFREERKNHLRFSYNYEFLASGSDFAVFLVTFGAGYFTDFNKKGFFPQTGLNLLLVLYENVCVAPYVKARYTIMTKKEESNIFDFSLGLKTAFYF